MLAVNLSNPDRCNADRVMSQNALQLAKDVFKNFDASQQLSSRIWTAMGKSIMLYQCNANQGPCTQTSGIGRPLRSR